MRPCLFILVSLIFGLLTSAAEQPKHWAFQPLAETKPPVSADDDWSRTPIDPFILSRLEGAGLKPAGPAEAHVLVRRITLDLTGLPPTPEEVANFVRDSAQDSTLAVATLVDRLLSSPHYGERWARWWLDVARYADTNGQDENKVMANAWRYRDWVIRAFNDNLPFDEFITQQLAGDLLPKSSRDEENHDHLIATGFLVLGPKMLAEQDKQKLVMDIVDEQIDTVGRAFLGLTLGCARCHDHKFDPVPARDYYAMAGIFKSTRTMEDLSFVSKFNERRIATQERLTTIESHTQQLREQTNRIAALVHEANLKLMADGDLIEVPKEPRPLYPVEIRHTLDELEKTLATLRSNAPPAAPFAMAVADDKPIDLPVHIRGSHLKLAAESVPRGFIQAASMNCPQPEIPAEQSGRLELARWITRPENPLTARVIVNRLWQAHFGEGLVRTPDNFGLRGEPPTHPELLDMLAGQFVRSGWDVKKMHRLILLSAVYQQSAVGVVSQADPENRLLSRFPRQRLEAEMIRDALLASSGRLDPGMGGSLVQWKNNEYVPGDEVSAKSARRTIYLPIVRDRVFDALTIFDFANPSVCSAKRTPTIVSHQALFFLNSPLVKESAETVAQRILAQPNSCAEDRVQEAYARLLGRSASPREVSRAVHFLAELPPGSAASSDPEVRQREDFAALCQTIFASNEFVYRN